MKSWEVTFYGDGWRLVVSLDYPDGDLGGLIEKAIGTARGGEISIDLQGYYEVSEVTTA